MSEISFEPSLGMRDFYPEDMVRRDMVSEVFRAAGEAVGFVPYDACVVENCGLLARKAVFPCTDGVAAGKARMKDLDTCTELKLRSNYFLGFID